VLGHLALSVTIAFALGFVWWPLVLSLLTAGIYLRAAWSVGLARNRMRLMFRAPGIVLRLGWLALGGLFHRGSATWERTSRPGERQIA
jgi:hypothetical protein